MDTDTIEEHYAYTEYFVGCARNWVPCTDSKVLVNKLLICVKKEELLFNKKVVDYLALCTG